jgi:hypothetical protein
MRSARNIFCLAILIALCSMSAKAQYKPAVTPDSNSLQLGVSYTFDRFNVVPHPSTVINTNGVTGSIVYYDNFIGSEGAVTDTFGSDNGKTSNLLFAGGGLRLRYPAGHSFEPWVHALLGYTRLSPQTSFGSDSAFGYKLGGGLDYFPHHSRFAWRIQGDALGTKFFRTQQFSPEISVGIVFLLSR